MKTGGNGRTGGENRTCRASRRRRRRGDALQDGSYGGIRRACEGKGLEDDGERWACIWKERTRVQSKYIRLTTVTAIAVMGPALPGTAGAEGARRQQDASQADGSNSTGQYIPVGAEKGGEPETKSLAGSRVLPPRAELMAEWRLSRPGLCSLPHTSRTAVRTARDGNTNHSPRLFGSHRSPSCIHTC